MKNLKIYFILALTVLLLTACKQTELSEDDITVGNTVDIEVSSEITEIPSPQPSVEVGADPYFNGDYNYLEENDDDVSYITDIIKTRIPETNINGKITYLSHTYDQLALTAMFAVTDSDFESGIFCVNFVCENGKYNLYDINQISPHLTSVDGIYEIYRHQMGAYVDTYIFRDTESENIQFLCEEQSTAGDDCGFFKNGDFYVMTQFGLKTFDITDGQAECKFDTQTNFPCGKGIDSKGTHRWLFALRRETDEQNYTVIYTEYPSDYNVEDRISEFQLKYNYLVGILDKNGNLKQSWNTGVPVVMTQYLNPVYMFKTGDNKIEFYVTFKEHEFLRGVFDLSDGIYTAIKDYERP